MRFNHLKINGFGKLVKKELELKPGINVIYGENEAGKSTLMKFLTAMLYGASKNKNGKSIPDFDKYKPWALEEFSGTLEYTLDDGENFDVYREFKKKNPIVYDKGRKDITKTFKETKSRGIAFFEEQTGIDEETYLNTAIIQQEEVKLAQNSQNAIIQKISNKVSSGDDNISYKKTLAQLTKLQGDKVGTDRTQNRPINRVNAEISKLEAKVRELEDIKKASKSSDTELEIFKKNIEQYEREKDEKIKNLSENSVQEEVQEVPKKAPILDYAILGILILIVALLLVFLENKIIGLISLIAPAIQIVRLVINDQKQVEAKHLAEEEETKAKEEKINLITEDIKAYEKEIEKMKKDLYEIEFCRKSDEKSLEELPNLVQKLDDLYEEKAELMSLNNSFNIAKECLDLAYEEVKKNISPQFSYNLCKTMEKISDGKYSFVKVTDDEGLVVELENGQYVSADRLSVGTIDQLYLSLRLSAVGEVSNEVLPIMLDEAFAYFDNERLRNVLEYLAKEYSDHQILIFTCSNREEAILEDLNIEYNYIEI